MAHRPSIGLVCALAAAALGTLAPVAARQTPQAGEFDVASVRHDVLPSSGRLNDVLPAPIRVLPGDRFETRRWLRSIVAFAYGVERPWDRITGGGPNLDELFAVSARGEPGSFAARSPDGLQPVRHMVQRLLAQRFKLEAHFEQEERRVLALQRDSPAKLGPTLRALPDGCDPVAPTFPEDVAPPGSKRPRCGVGNAGIDADRDRDHVPGFAREISESMKQEIVDETGLAGVYAFETTFDKETLFNFPPGLPGFRPGQYSDLPSFRTAPRADLALVLEPATRTVPVLVITRIEPLVEN